MTMRIAGEKVFRFNPFIIQEWTDRELIEQYTLMEESLNKGDTPMEIADDIDIYANMGYLVGEMISRYYKIVSDLQNDLKIKLNTDIYKTRQTWTKMNSDKPPAMSYFEALCVSKLQDAYETLSEKESLLKRFKFAYESISDKQNALKKKLESIKFDVLNR